jgi:hypothetical protein
MDDRDEELRLLIEGVQQSVPKTLAWRKAMNRLLAAIQRLPGLARSNHPNYADVLNDVLLRLGDEIKTFQPQQPSLEKSLTNWINLKLRLTYEVRELHAPPRSRASTVAKSAKADFQRQAQKPPLSLDAPLGEDGHINLGDQLPTSAPCTLWELDESIRQAQEQQKAQRVGLQLTQYIHDDPDDLLKQCHPQSYPACHCQMLSQRLLLNHPPDRMAALAREFNINYHTLNWHWKNRGLPLLQAIAQKFGYQTDRELEE